MRRGDQPVIVPAEVENQHCPAAADFHGIRGRVTVPHIHQIAPIRLLDRLAPNVQVTGCRGMLLSRCQKRFFNPWEILRLGRRTPEV